MHGIAQNLRTHPRVELDLPIALEVGPELRLEVRLIDLSAAGMQWVCDDLAAARIVPRAARARPETAPEIEVHLTLPGARGLDVRARCRPAFLRRVRINEYRIGLSFTTFHGDSLEILESYIQICLQTRR